MTTLDKLTEGFTLLNTIKYGENIYSSVFVKDRCAIIIDHNICSQDSPLFDYDLYTQSQNQLIAKYDTVYRYLDTDKLIKEPEPNYSKARYLDITNTRADVTPTEHFFEERFAECYGRDALEYLQKEYPIYSSDGTNEAIDYAVVCKDGSVIGVEENGVNYHHPQLIGREKYKHQLEKQNTCAEHNIKLYRFSSIDCQFPDRVKDEILYFFGDKKNFKPQALNSKRNFELYDYQKIKIEDLKALREKEEYATALIVLPTAAGKTQIILEDLNSLYKENKNLKVLAVGPTRKVAQQWEKDFQRYNFPPSFESGTYQKLHRKKTEVGQDYYDYIIIDEAHHAVAPSTYNSIKYFTPHMLVGLTATPERLDKKRLDAIFGEYEVALTLQEAMEKKVIADVHVFRIITNINLSQVRYKGKDFIASDLERTISTDLRDNTIVNTVKEYLSFPHLKGVAFCINIKHAKRLSEAFNKAGIKSAAVSGKDRDSDKILDDFKANKYQIICSCALLNEGWNVPDINLLIMARPTLSKVLYMQQLGRGLRRTKDKTDVLVLDVVDQYGAILKPWSAHAVFGFSQYCQFAVLKSHYELNESVDLFGYHETVTRIEEVDYSTFEDKYKDYLSTEQTARELFIGTSSLKSWIKKGEATPDLTLPFGRSSLFYFKPETIEKIREEKKLSRHTEETLKQDFFDFIKEKQFTFSFKIIFMLSLMECVNINGEAELDVVLKKYIEFYKARINNNLPVDKKGCVYNSERLSDLNYMKNSMLENPFEKFERKRFIYYGKDISMLSFNPTLWLSLNDDDKAEIVSIMEQHKEDYYRNIVS